MNHPPASPAQRLQVKQVRSSEDWRSDSSSETNEGEQKIKFKE